MTEVVQDMQLTLLSYTHCISMLIQLIRIKEREKNRQVS